MLHESQRPKEQALLSIHVLLMLLFPSLVWFQKQGGVPQAPREVDPSSLPLAPQMGLSRRGKSRIPGGPEVGKEGGGLELVKERPDDILSPSRPQALETPESLSDSLYDSLSSCGSQG